jgi:hypothetical protein
MLKLVATLGVPKLRQSPNQCGAPDYESGGQEFESLRARHLLIDIAQHLARRLLSNAVI